MKLSDFPISPVVSIFIGKIVGIIFASVVFSIQISSLGYASLFKLLYGATQNNDIVTLSSYSDLFMFTVLSTGLVITLLIYTDRAKNNMSKKLVEDYFASPLEQTFNTARKLYGGSFIWLLILWITNIYILYNTLSGRTYLWIYLLVFSLSISLTTYFLLDLKKEMQLAKLKLFNNEL